MLFVVDVRAGVTALDRDIAQLLHRRARPVIPVANKVDGPSIEPLLSDLYTLGLGDPVGVSAEHGLGVNELLARVSRILEAADRAPHDPDQPHDRTVQRVYPGRNHLDRRFTLLHDGNEAVG